MSNFANYTADDLERLINNIYAGSVNASRLPVDLYETILNRLTDAVFRGFGGTIEDFKDEAARKLLLEYYVHNIAIFSGAKTFQQVKDMSNLVFDANGMKRDFNEFRKIITGDGFHKGIFNVYNDAWLRTEYDTAFGTAQMGAEWISIQEDKDVFPYLKYVTAKDERVRHSHAEFDGVVRPVDDPFWDTHTPLNGFNCRCRLIQLNEDDDVFTVTPDEKIKKLSPPDSDLFAFNPGKNTYIFDEKHPYTANVPEKYKVSQSVNFGFPTPKKPSNGETI